MRFQVKYMKNIQPTISKIYFFEVDAIDNDEAQEKIEDLFEDCFGYVENVEEIK